MYKQFRKDPYFLQKYYVLNFLCLGTGITLINILHFRVEVLYFMPICLLFCSSSFSSILVGFALSLASLPFIVESLPTVIILFWLTTGIYTGIWCNVLIHNASHNLVGGKFLNRLVGELTGLQLLSGFPGFALIHIEHHKHSDDLDKDPHPNQPGQSFWAYINETRSQLRKCFSRLYREQWENDDNFCYYQKSWRQVKLLLPFTRAMRAALILCLLGPIGFCFGFIISHITTQLAFGIINFYSHIRKEDGSVEIINLNHNLLFKVLNHHFSGAFFHKNHHIKPSLFNPMKLKN